MNALERQLKPQTDQGQEDTTFRVEEPENTTASEVKEALAEMGLQEGSVFSAQLASGNELDDAGELYVFQVIAVRDVDGEAKVNVIGSWNGGGTASLTELRNQPEINLNLSIQGLKELVDETTIITEPLDDELDKVNLNSEAPTEPLQSGTQSSTGGYKGIGTSMEAVQGLNTRSSEAEQQAILEAAAEAVRVEREAAEAARQAELAQEADTVVPSLNMPTTSFAPDGNPGLSASDGVQEANWGMTKAESDAAAEERRKERLSQSGTEGDDEVLAGFEMIDETAIEDAESELEQEGLLFERGTLLQLSGFEDMPDGEYVFLSVDVDFDEYGEQMPVVRLMNKGVQRLGTADGSANGREFKVSIDDFIDGRDRVIVENGTEQESLVAQQALEAVETANQALETQMGVTPQEAQESAQDAEEVVAKTLWQRIKTEGLFSSLRKVMSGDHQLENAVARTGITAEEDKAGSEAVASAERALNDEIPHEDSTGWFKDRRLQESRDEYPVDDESAMAYSAAAREASLASHKDRLEQKPLVTGNLYNFTPDQASPKNTLGSRKLENPNDYGEVEADLAPDVFAEYERADGVKSEYENSVQAEQARRAKADQKLESSREEYPADPEAARVYSANAAMDARDNADAKLAKKPLDFTGISLNAFDPADLGVARGRKVELPQEQTIAEVPTEAISAVDLEELLAESPTTTVETLDATVEVEYDPTVAGVKEFVQAKGGTVVEGGLRFTLKTPLAGEPYVQVYLAKTGESVRLNQGRVNWLLENGYALGTAADARSADMPDRVWEQFVQETEPEEVSASSLEEVEEPTQVVERSTEDGATTLMEVEEEPVQMVEEDESELPTELSNAHVEEVSTDDLPTDVVPRKDQEAA